jgi:LacI family transcriptional regulator
VAAGTAGGTTSAAQVSVSHELLVRGAVRRAFDVGHRRVSFPLWRRTPEVAGRMRGWIAAEYAAAGYRHAPEFDAPVVADREPTALHATLHELLRHTPPTALISSDFQQWLATVTALAKIGLRVPRDVSLICLCSTPDWETATPTQAHFRFPVAELAKSVRKSLDAAARGATPRDVSLAPEWVPGGSLGAPPGGL